MTEMIGYCGYSCHLCAARSDDPTVRERLVDGWRKYLGHEHYTAENVRCDGCRVDGKLADKECKACPCAMEKGITSCAVCDEFPCEKMRFLMASREGLLAHCYPRTCDITEDDYDLCLRQFESIPNLLRILVDAGRISPWVSEA